MLLLVPWWTATTEEGEGAEALLGRGVVGRGVVGLLVVVDG
jgi:hypothetical protein